MDNIEDARLSILECNDRGYVICADLSTREYVVEFEYREWFNDKAKAENQLAEIEMVGGELLQTEWVCITSRESYEAAAQPYGSLWQEEQRERMYGENY